MSDSHCVVHPLQILRFPSPFLRNPLRNRSAAFQKMASGTIEEASTSGAMCSNNDSNWDLWTADIDQESKELQHVYSQLRAGDFIPGSEDISAAGEALNLLRKMVLGDTARPLSSEISATVPQWYSEDAGMALVLTVVGNYALRIWYPFEEILVSIAGTPSRSTFFELLSENLDRNRSNARTITAKRDAGDMFELDIGGLKITLRYSQWPVGSLITGGSSQSTALSQPNSRWPSDWRLTSERYQALSKQRYYQVFYYLVRCWTINDGIYSGRLGYLDEYTLVVLTSCAIQAQDEQAFEISESSQVRSTDSFAHQVESFWKKFIQLCAHLDHTISTTKTGARIRTNHKLRKVDIATEVLRYEAPCTEPSSWESSPVFRPMYKLFLSSFQWYIRVQLSYWSPHSYPGRLISRVEKTIAACLKSWSTSSHSPGNIRLWPERFVDNANEQPGTSSCYLLGWTQSDHQEIDDILASFTTIFERQLEAFGSFDATLCAVHCDRVLPTDVQNFMPDPSKYNLHLITDETKAEDGDDEVPRKTRIRGNPESISRPQAASPTAAGSSKKSPLRPALDVLNRIQHDPDFDVEDYVIGYHDRHEGMKEMPFTKWQGKDISAEDFIPQHRIYYVSTRNGLKVWDRMSMVDLVFYSGATDPPR